MNINQPITWRGEINRKDYLIWGLVLFTVKFNLDRFTAITFEKTWYITDYFIQADRLSVMEIPEGDRMFYLALLIQSLPFIWFGTVLCVKRLRSANIPSWLVIFFFIPFINFILFIILAALPERNTIDDTKQAYLDKLIPKNQFGSAFFAIGLVLILSLGLTLVFVKYINEYGWSLFVGIPFFLGFGSVIIYGQNNKLRYWDALSVMFFSVLFFNLIIFVAAVEGIICIAMGFPIAIIIGVIGASIGYAVIDNRKVNLNILTSPLAVVLLFSILEHSDDQTPPLTPPKNRTYNIGSETNSME